MQHELLIYALRTSGLENLGRWQVSGTAASSPLVDRKPPTTMVKQSERVVIL
jgi:hypothetical protein